MMRIEEYLEEFDHGKIFEYYLLLAVLVRQYFGSIPGYAVTAAIGILAADCPQPRISGSYFRRPSLQRCPPGLRKQSQVGLKWFTCAIFLWF